MGFFSSLFGGGGKSTSVSNQGYASLPADVQSYYQTLTSQAGDALLSGKNRSNLFRPLPTTTQEHQAYNLMQVPTSSKGVSSLVDTYMNPFTSYITDAINREAAGGYSAYKSALADSGQMGSNREFLNAAAFDNARLNSIGSALSNEYNTALQTGLSQNQQNIANLLGQGALERDLYTQGQQSGITGLQTMANLLNTLYSGTGTSSETKKEGGGSMLGTIGGLFSAPAGGTSAAAGIASALMGLSDRRLKENIEKVGEENGFNVYTFNYKGTPQRWTGVMADEVEEKRPDAVHVLGGFKAVDYGAIGIEMRRVA